MNEPQVNFVLPPSVISKIDVSRLLVELEQVDLEQTEAAARQKAGAPGRVEMVLSRSLAEFLEQNNQKIEDSQARAQLIKELRAFKEHVPIIHMTFAVPADRGSLQQLVQWVRTSLHPQAVIEVGLQPTLVAGVSIRTPNHVHDLSMRAMLKKNHGLLVKELGALRGNG